jgi:uncharacterized protein YegL
MKRIIVDQPETIDISLLVDCSASMWGDKEEMAKQTTALLMYSIKDFNHELDRGRYKTNSKLRANTEVINFGSDYDVVKPFERKAKRNGENNNANIIKTISSINNEYGGTDDCKPLEYIQNSISIEEMKKIKEKKLKKIVFEITDGRPYDPHQTSDKVKQLAREGVIVVGFQIGDVGQNERDIFEQIWNNDEVLSNGGKGIYIGQDISSLPTKLMKELSDSLNDIII